MHSSTVVAAILAAGVSAQTATQTLMLPVFTSTEVPSVTVIASNAQATTYTLNCKNGLNNLTDIFNSATSVVGSAASSVNAAISSVQSAAGSAALTLKPITGIPTSLPTGLVRRQDNDDNNFGIPECIPMQIVQGPKTWEAHLTVSDANLSLNVNCQFGGADIFKGPATCTEMDNGQILGTGTGMTTTTDTIPLSSYSSWAHAVAITQGPNGAAANPTASGSKGTSTGTAAAHTGAAAAMHIPGAMGAGAMAVLGAALAL